MQNILKKHLVIGITLSGVIYCHNGFSSSGDEDIKANAFKVKYEVKTTPVKSQYRTGTCWNYSTLSFLESEVMRETGKELDLSELFIIRKAFIKKAEKFIRYQGTTNFAQSGQAHDAINIIKDYGVAPESVLPINKTNDYYKNHIEMTKALSAVLNNTLTDKMNGLEGLSGGVLDSIMDVYLGSLSDEFEFEGKKYTAKSFQKEFVNLDFDNYIEMTSFMYHLYYKEFELELPDNWDHGKYYNVPLNDLIETIDNSLKNGYSVVWDGDIIDTRYDISKTIYELPGETGAKNLLDIGAIPAEERQKLFDNWTTTDDHLMHLVGFATDSIGRKYYMFKDSAGENHPTVYMSESYIRLNTIAIMVNKKGLPADLNKKLF